MTVFYQTCNICTTPAGCVARGKCGYQESQKTRPVPANYRDNLVLNIDTFVRAHGMPPTYIRMHPAFHMGVVHHSVLGDWDHFSYEKNLAPSELGAVLWRKFMGIPIVKDRTVATYLLVLEVEASV